MIVAHLGLLHVPYFWDEMYFASAARELLVSGNLIPSTVGAESHPPLVYIWLAIWWKLFGFSIPVARIAMLTISALTLAGIYRLGRLLTTGAVPIAATMLTAVYPVFFTESTMVLLDMPAAGFVLWGLVAHLRGWHWRAGVLFSLAVLAKDTAFVAPLAVLTLEIVLAIRDHKRSLGAATKSAWKAAFPLLIPVFVLLCWFMWLYHVSGSVFGNAHYVNENLHGTLNPARIVLAGAQHIWHLLIYLNLYVLTGLAATICLIFPSSRANCAQARQPRVVNACRGHCRICHLALHCGRCNLCSLYAASLPTCCPGIGCSNCLTGEMVAGSRESHGGSFRSRPVPIHELASIQA
ncbi:MAG TPA: glycosyltransferase family 39 protein [Terracidiphilus sp.]|jgi:4-amino-4-deoxy-L-arabinose transferase-like glycosyltransferase